MARHGPTDLVHWVGGFDLAGLGALSECSESLVASTVDATPIGPEGAVRRSIPLGQVDYKIQETGWYDPYHLSLRELLAGSTKPAAPWASIFGYTGGAIGDLVTLATDMRLGSHEVIHSVDDLTKIAVEYYLGTGGKVYQGVPLIANGVVTDVTAEAGTPPASRVHDGGAASSGGGTFFVMVDVDGTRWRGYAKLTIQVRHSTALGSSWANLGSSWALKRNQANAGQLVLPITTTINRYTHIRFTFSGTRDAFLTKGGIPAHADTFVLDGGSGQERIEPGDKLSIVGETHTVLSAEEIASGEWRVVLASPNGGTPVANNAAVTITGSNVALRYIAALHRN